jgi:hypothetical protein
MVAQETVDLASAFFIGLILFLAIYAFLGWLLYRIGRKLGYYRSWYAWIPFANLYMLVDLSYRSTGKWFLLIIILGLIPIANLVSLVMMIIVYMDISERCGKGRWWGLLWIIPVIDLVIIFILGSGRAPKRLPAKGTWSPDEHLAFQGYPDAQAPPGGTEKPYRPTGTGKPPSSSSWV